MSRWDQVAGLAAKHGARGLHVVMANPFRSNDEAAATAVRKIVERGLHDHPNVTFHRFATHPLVDKHGPEMSPGWNVSNAEILVTRRDACYVLFDRDGQLVFRGRLTFAELEALLARTL